MKSTRALTRSVGIAAAMGLALGLTACSSNDDDAGDTPAADTAVTDCEPAGKKVTIQYWNWISGMQEVVDVWNAANPDIQVEIKDISEDSNGALSNAIKANQAPELAQVPYDSLTTYRMQDMLTDVSACADAVAAEDQYVPWTWSQTSFDGDGVFGIPQDTGPEVLYYRADLFEKHGIAVPETWEEYTAAAEALKAADPNLSIGFFDPSDASAFNGYLWQNSANMYSFVDDQWQISIANDQSEEVATFWQDLIDRDLVRTDLRFGSNPMFNAYSQDQVATLVTASWGFSMFRDNLPDQSGNWRVAPMPQWTAGENKAGNWGGSSVAFMTGNKYPYESAKFAMWLNNDPEAVAMLNDLGGLYPASLDGLELPQFQEGVEFYGDQKIFDVFKEASSGVDPDFQWGPVQTEANTALTDALAGVSDGTTTISEALAASQEAAIKAMKSKSIPVSDN